MTSESDCTAAPVPSPLDGFLFIRDWLDGEALLREHLPDVESMITRRLADLGSGCWIPWTAEEVASVAEFNQAIGNPNGSRMADLLSKRDALVIVTGQQPDLLNAPLYVLHKALSAIAWSRKVAERTGRPVIPAFWVASDDDDFAELKQAWHVAFDGSLVDVGRKVSRGFGKLAGSPAYSWDLGESRDRLISDLNGIFQGWTNGVEITEYIGLALDHSTNFEIFFCRLMVELLGSGNEMLFIAPRLKPFRDRQVGLLKDDMAVHSELNPAINEVAGVFEAGGYPVSLHRDAHALNFFWINEGRRHKLLRRDGLIVAIEPRHNAVTWKKTDAEVEALLEAEPWNFAPNVVTRPVLQDVVLPAVAYIAGPGEFAYLALLGKAYSSFKKSRAAVVPRTFVTMMPSCQIRRATCLHHPDEIPDAILNNGEDSSGALLDQIKELMANSRRSIDTIRESVGNENPAVKVALDKTEAHILRGVEHLKRRLAKQVSADEWKRANRLASIVAPAGSSQERMLSPWNFVKAGEWAALTNHLVAHCDYTAQVPQTVPLPGWIETDL